MLSYIGRECSWREHLVARRTTDYLECVRKTVRRTTWPPFELTVSNLLQDRGINELEATMNIRPVILMIMVLAFIWGKSRQLPL